MCKTKYPWNPKEIEKDEISSMSSCAIFLRLVKSDVQYVSGEIILKNYLRSKKLLWTKLVWLSSLLVPVGKFARP